MWGCCGVDCDETVIIRSALRHAGAHHPQPKRDPRLDAFVALLGVAVGVFATITVTNLAERRRFVRDQLTLLYSPLVARRRQMYALSELRVTVDNEADEAWRENVARVERRRPPPEDFEEALAEPKAQLIDGLLAFNAARARADLEVYAEMLTIFREQMWLADPDTLDSYPAFVRFVDLWTRWVKDELPPDLARRLEIKESRLVPFYEHLERRMLDLRAELASPRWIPPLIGVHWQPRLPTAPWWRRRREGASEPKDPASSV